MGLPCPVCGYELGEHPKKHGKRFNEFCIDALRMQLAAATAAREAAEQERDEAVGAADTLAVHEYQEVQHQLAIAIDQLSQAQADAAALQDAKRQAETEWEEAAKELKQQFAASGAVEAQLREAATGLVSMLEHTYTSRGPGRTVDFGEARNALEAALALPASEAAKRYQLLYELYQRVHENWEFAKANGITEGDALAIDALEAVEAVMKEE